MTPKKPYRLLYLSGLAAIAVSLCFFLFAPEPRDQSFNDPFSGIFFLNYFLLIGYFISLLLVYFSGERPRPGIPHRCWINLVVLFTISAFSLNTSMHVFAPFPFWLNVYTVCSIMLLLVFPYLKQLTPILQAFIYFLAGAAFVLAVYMVWFISPLLPISVGVTWFFGISLHSFVPLLWVWSIVHLLFLRINRSTVKFAFIAGFSIPLIFLGIYLNKWRDTQNLITDILAEKFAYQHNTLPDAIVLAQQLPDDPLSEMVLVAPFRSQTIEENFLSRNNNGDDYFHDPLAIIGTACYGKVNISSQTAETVLNIRQDARHKTSRRLWTGNNLSTTSVTNNIQVFPAARMAYQEKIINIHNEPGKNSRAWFTSFTNEAVYTFHLPEGGIVTSLSLWINGKEEKSRLTTKQKADSAYTTIVGVEQRDPALVHWQEGNRITVTIFPCTPTEDRQFKIGFTTPLLYDNNQLHLQHVWFEGPDMNHAREYTRVKISGTKDADVVAPDWFETNAHGEFIYKGDYEPDWKMSFSPVAVSKDVFVFGGSQYSLKEMSYDTENLNIKNIYLDVMCEWTKDEFDQVIEKFPDKKIFVWLPEQVQVNSSNKEKIWEQLSSYQFSMPYLYRMENPHNSIVITKSGYKTPLLSDLKNSDYALMTQKFLAHQNGKINVFNIGEELSPFWKSLHELRLIHYVKGDLDDLVDQAKKNTITYAHEDSSTVSLTSSRMCIVKTPVGEFYRSGAPDHLMRVFAYNDVMRKTGENYFSDQQYQDEIYREAEEAHVVTPVTSLIVLETVKDYERMGITENTNTVGNALVTSGGAVPEPHEWALIAGVLLFITWQWSKKKKQRSVRI